MSDEQLEFDAVPIEHIPVRAARAGHIGEEVFSAKWAEMMDAQPAWFDEAPAAMLHSVLSHFHKKVLGQREASVAATFSVWLGCNAGSSIIHAGRALLKLGAAGRERYLMAWARANQRQNGINGSIRLIEFMLAPEDHFTREPYAPHVLRRLPDLSADDYEVVEHLFTWLGSDEGEDWLVACEAEVQRRQAEAYRAERRERAELFGALS